MTTVALYKSTNKINGNFYIGITKQELSARINVHFQHARSRKSCRKFHAALIKYGKENFSWETIGTFTSYEDALKAEESAIADLNPSYNISRGGRIGCLGLPRNMEWRKKISKSLKGRTPSDATKHGFKTWIANGGKQKRVMCLSDNKVFCSLKVATEYYGLNKGSITRVCSGEWTQTSGLKFKIMEEL